MEAEASGEVFDFQGWECLGKYIGDHISGGTVCETNAAIIDKPADEVKLYVDML